MSERTRALEGPSSLATYHLPAAALLAILLVTNRACAQVRTVTASESQVGSVSQALVGVEVSIHPEHGQPPPARHGIGLIIRCDGFVLAPSALFPETHSAGSDLADPQTVSIVIAPGSDHERRISDLPRPRFFPRDVPYVVFKVPGVRIPAARTLLPIALGNGDTVRVRWRPWADGAMLGGEETAESPISTDGRVPGYLRFERFEAGRPDVPVGAVVEGPDGMAVGIVTARDGRFATFEQLDQATNCVAACPTADDEFRQREAALPETERMVAVPGADIRMPRAIVEEQRDMDRETVACVPPFHIDRFEVTNAQYLRFWRALPELVRTDPHSRADLYPLGWAPAGDPFPEPLANFPVLGVPLAGAKAFASAQGKRLPTPYEWCLAALGPEGERASPDWVRQYMGDRLAAWQRVEDRHAVYSREHADMLAQDGGGAISRELPWIVNQAENVETSVFSRDAVEEETGRLWTAWSGPHGIAAAGSRAYDAGPSGVRDLWMNAVEMFLPSPASPARGALRWLAIDWATSPPASGTRNEWTIRGGTDFEPPLDTTVSLRSRLSRSLGLLIGTTLDQQRRGGYILASIATVVAHLYGEAALLQPVSGWFVRVGNETKTTVALSPSLIANVNRALTTDSEYYIYEHAGYGAWRGLPRHYLAAAGSTIALNKGDRPLPPASPDDFVRPDSAALTFLVPVGFRCAR